MAPGTYGKTWWREGYACGCMIQSIEDIIEPRLRAAGHLGANETINIFQQAYSGNVSASGGTHDGGGALDHAKGNDAETIIWRECGVADWQRGSPEDSAFDDHNHGIWQGCEHLDGSAESQIDQYKAGCSGLSGWGPDQSPHVDPITWQKAYDKYIGDTGGGGGGEGILDMSKSVYERRGNDYVVKKLDDFDDLMVNDDGGYTVVSGETDQITCSAAVQVEGLKAGQYFAVMWRIAKFKEGTDTTYPYKRLSQRVYAPKDNAMVSVSADYNGSLPDVGSGYSPRLRLGYKTDSTTAKVVAVICEGWKT